VVIFRDEVQAPPAFSYTTSCRCWHACASFWANFGWLYRQGGRLNFNRMPCCCRQGAPTKTLVSWLEFYHLRLIYAQIFNALARALNVSVTSSTNTHILCVFGQCGVLVYPFAIWHDHVRQAKSWLAT
jgi:hypothetical protein